MSLIKANKKRRLQLLANYIQQNPRQYDHSRGYSCAVGLGLKLAGVSIDGHGGIIDEKQIRQFASIYGLTYQKANYIYNGKYNARVRDTGWIGGIPAEETVKYLRGLAG